MEPPPNFPAVPTRLTPQAPAARPRPSRVPDEIASQNAPSCVSLAQQFRVCSCNSDSNRNATPRSRRQQCSQQCRLVLG
jgi:hypothetical protein